MDAVNISHSPLILSRPYHGGVMVRNATSVAMLDATSCLHLLMQIAFFDLQFHYIPKLSLVGISFLSKSIDYFHALPFLCFFIFCCRLSGLIVDIFGDEAVVASSAAWVEKYKQQIKDCIGRINNINNVTWRPSTEILKEEGLDFSDSAFVESSNSSRMVKVKFQLYLDCTSSHCLRAKSVEMETDCLWFIMDNIYHVIISHTEYTGIYIILADIGSLMFL